MVVESVDLKVARLVEMLVGMWVVLKAAARGLMIVDDWIEKLVAPRVGTKVEVWVCKKAARLDTLMVVLMVK